MVGGVRALVVFEGSGESFEERMECVAGSEGVGNERECSA